MPREQEVRASRQRSRASKPRRYARHLPRVNNAATVIQRWWRLQQYRQNAQRQGRITAPTSGRSPSNRKGGSLSVDVSSTQQGGGLTNWVESTNVALSPHTSKVPSLRHVPLPGGEDAYTAGRYASPIDPRGNHAVSQSSPVPSPLSGTTKRLQDILHFLDNVDAQDDDNDDQEEGTDPSQIDLPAASAAGPSGLASATELEISEQGKIIVLLRKTLKDQREQEEKRIRKLHHAFKTRTVAMQKEHESSLARQLDMVDALVKDKTDLSRQCEKLTHEMAGLEQRLHKRVDALKEEHDIELKRQKDIWAAGEKIRKDQFIAAKSKEIRDTTIKGLEPEIQRLISKHKNEQQRWSREHEQALLSQELALKKRHEAELEQIRIELGRERDSARDQERETMQERLTRATLDTEDQLRAQMKRFTETQQEEHRRHDLALAEQKQMFEAQVDRLKQVQEQALETQKQHYEESLALAQERAASAVEQAKAQDVAERQAWESSRKVEQDQYMQDVEAQLRAKLQKERDEQINVVLLRLRDEQAKQSEAKEAELQSRVEQVRDEAIAQLDKVKAGIEDAEERFTAERTRADELQMDLNQARANQQAALNQCTTLQSEVSDLQGEVHDLRSHLARALASVDARVDDATRAATSEAKTLRQEMAALQGDMAQARKAHESELRNLVQRKAQELDTVHDKVRATIQKKDEKIEQLQKRIADEQAKSAATMKLLEKQRAAYLS